ncbi:O-antigen ligase family protein [Leifsonia bigeumensis]|uniref:O-antigen ligase family protein n=1 Tax=Leifsonella bigeumensis TaxID=433643 RepID=A0ABP7FDP6_9MICO
MKSGQRFDVIVAFLSSARFVTALSTATIGAAACSFAIRQTIGWAGFFGILGVLLALWVIVLISRRGEIEWNGLLPISLMVFVGWAVISVFWSRYQWVTLGSVAYLLAFTILGVAVALLRDTIQLVRAFGDVLRFALIASLVLEIVAGLLLDVQVRFLSVSGNLDHLGPLQGIFGARNQLGIVAMVAIATFVIELRTKSVPRGLGVGSLVLAAASLVLSQSPVAMGATVIVAAAALALYGLRRTSPERRRFWQFTLLGSAIVVAVLSWVFRARIIDLLDATKEADYRLNLWRRVWDLIPLHSFEGWGWVGGWRLEIVPYVGIRGIPGGAPGSAANAFLDVWLQLGFVGLIALLVLVSLAFVRSWLLAARRRSVVFTWPALVLLTLILTSIAESSILVEFGWLTLVVCTVKASRELSWRQAFTTTPMNPQLPHEH